MLNPVRPGNIALVLCACLLSFAPSVQAVSAGAPPPPPTWSLGEIDEPLTIPQEGVIVLHAVYEMYGFALGEGDATYTVTVSAQDGEEIAGEATYTHERSTLTWRAAAPPLEPSDALTIHLELINILPAVDEDIVRDIALVVSDSATPELIGAEIVHHVPTTGANRVNGLPGMPGYTCQAPNSAIKWAPATALPTWMHRLLSYNVALVTADGDLRIAVDVGSFADSLTYFTWIDDPEELIDDHCLQLVTMSDLDSHTSIVETSCIDEQAFIDDLDEGQVLCTPDNLADHLIDEDPDDDPVNPTDDPNDEPSDDGGCTGTTGSSTHWLLGLLGLLLLARQRKLLGRI